MSKSIKNILGQKFGKLTVVRFLETKRRNDNPKSYFTAYWLCKCDCGNSIELSLGTLTSGNTQSCGCMWREKMVLPRGQGSFLVIYRRYKSQAQTRGHVFEIPLEEFRDITAQGCFYCGASPNNSGGSNQNFGKYTYNGIDRVDNTIGYVEGNIVPCCRRCNRAKDVYTLPDFYNWVESIHNNRGKNVG
jgi:hypothetical protein